MNERIKELWENCDEIYTRYPKKGSPIYASPELLEKFAELIVRECMNVIYNIDDLGGYHFKAVNEVKTHFGVEE